MAFKLAQTFVVDKNAVKNAEHVTVTGLDLYFKSKPRSTSNKSGIVNPGVSVYITDTASDDSPNLASAIFGAYSRNEYDSVVASADASIVTRFNFNKPVILDSGKSYAIVLAADGDEDYEVWKLKEGENIVGTNTVAGASVAIGVGKYYEYSSYTDSSINPWKPLNDTDIKFTVYVGVYADSVSNTDIDQTYLLPSDPVEYIAYDQFSVNTSNASGIAIGDIVYQETPVLYGPIIVSANSLYVNAVSNNINFSTLISASNSVNISVANTDPVINQKSYIVLRNGSTQSSNVCVKEVINIVSNTSIVLDSLPNFSSNSCTFSVTAVGKVSQNTPHWYTGRWYDYSAHQMNYFTSRRVNLLRLTEVNSNSSVRFVNNYVESMAIVSGGTAYSNSDYIVVSPSLNSNTANAAHISYIQSYANAYANVVTNSSGVITGIAFSNSGFGLISNCALSISTSTGSGANITFTVGSTIKSAVNSSRVANTVVDNIPVHRLYPSVNVLDNQHHTYRTFQHYSYYSYPNFEHLVNAFAVADKREIEVNTNNDAQAYQYSDNRFYVLASASNEAVMSSNVVINVANGSNVSTSVKSSTILELSMNSNNAFSIPMVITNDVYNYNYLINNDDTNEFTGNGKAIARHVSDKVTFADGRNAEDLLVYINAYKPQGTSIKVYARMLSKSDTEAFDDKDWTELVIKSGNESAISSLTNKNDIFEFSYGLPSTPSTVSVISGSAQATLNSANVAGVQTTWSTSLANNDLIKMYDPLFPANYIVCSVSNVVNNTLMIVDTLITDTNLDNGNLNVELVGRPGVNQLGRPHSVFINNQNSYVCRYYNSSMSKFDTFNSFAIKMVLLSENPSVIPEIVNIRAVGVSA